MAENEILIRRIARLEASLHYSNVVTAALLVVALAVGFMIGRAVS